MSNNGRHNMGLTPEELVAHLDSLADLEPWVDYGPIFVEHLDHKDPTVRAAAIRGLWHAPEPGRMERLIVMADQDPSPDVRAAAISGLGIYVYHGDVAAYDLDYGPLTELLKENEISEADFDRVKGFLLSVYADETRTLDERRFAVESLAFAGEEQVVAVIEDAFDRPERDMKISALFAMGRSGMERWADILARELFNSEPDLQREAIRAVGEIGLSELGKDVWRLTYADDKDIMLEAIEALGQTGWEQAFERLDELSDDPDPEIAQVAEDAMSEWMFVRELLDLDDGWDDDPDDWDEMD